MTPGEEKSSEERSPRA